MNHKPHNYRVHDKLIVCCKKAKNTRILTNAPNRLPRFGQIELLPYGRAPNKSTYILYVLNPIKNDAPVLWQPSFR